jgi:hypothetical protein
VTPRPACQYCGLKRKTAVIRLVYHDQHRNFALVRGKVDLCAGCQAKLFDKYPLAFQVARKRVA